MNQALLTNWRAHKLAYLSLVICLLEVTVFFCIAIFATTPRHQSLTLRKLTGITWIFGGPMSIGFSLAGLFLDTRRGTAFIALILAIACWCFCTLQVLV